MNAETLKPCPFCGGEADFQYHNGGWPDACYSVRCKDWKCPGKTSSGYQAVAADAWNTRAADNIALQAEVEAFKVAARKVLPLMEDASREEVTDCADWDEAEALFRAALNETPEPAAALPG